MCRSGGGSRVRGRGRSGPRRRVSVIPQILEWTLRTSSVSEDNLPTSISEEGLTNSFTGSNFTEVEQQAGFYAFRRSSSTANERATYYVTLRPPASGGTTASPRIIVYTIVANTNTSELQFHKIGTPTSTLITDAQVTTINQRLSSYNIRLSGNWNPEHTKIALTAINLLSDTELGKLQNLQLRRSASPGRDVTGRDAARVGGHYHQDNNTVTMFDTTFINGPLMAYGTTLAQMYPNGIHAILHELGHVIVYSEVRSANAQALTSRRDFDSARRRMRSRWSEHYSETVDAEGGVRYSTADPRSIQDSTERSAYQADLRRLQRAEQSVVTAQQSGGESAGTQAFTRFQQAARNQAPTTPYSRDEAQAATDADLRAKALEEFLVESFAIYKWDSAWLQANRSPIYNYFNQNQHL